MVSKCKDDWKHTRFLFDTVLDMMDSRYKSGFAYVDETEQTYAYVEGYWLPIQELSKCENCGSDWWTNYPSDIKPKFLKCVRCTNTNVVAN